MRILGVDCAKVIFYPLRFEEVFNAVESLSILANSKQFDKIYLVSRASLLTRPYYRFRLRRLSIWARTGIPKRNLYFCWRNRQKSDICKQLGITDFIDDNLSVLKYMSDIKHKFAFNPTKENISKYTDVLPKTIRVFSWDELVPKLLEI